MRVSSLDLGASSADPYITSFVQTPPNWNHEPVPPVVDTLGWLGECDSCRATKNVTGVPGYTPRSQISVLDRPYKRDNSGLPMAQSLGYVMGIPALEKAKSDDPQNLILVRATNMAALVSAWILQFKPEKRLQAIESVAGVAWAQDVMKLANNLPGGKLGIGDAVRFSLGLHFLKGILEHSKRDDTADARAYVSFAIVFKQSEARFDERHGSTTQLGALDAHLGALGEDCSWYDVVCGAKKAASAIKSAVSAAADKVVSAAKTVGEGISKVADMASDLLCSGLKKLPVIGPTIGGVICWILEKGIDIIKNTLLTVIELITTSIVALKNFFAELLSGNVLKAVMALLEGLTQMVFLLFAPVAVTFLYPGNKSKEGIQELKDIGKKVAKKNPFFIVSVAFAIIGIVTAAAAGGAAAASSAAQAVVPGKGGQTNPLVTAISTLILALAPAIGVVAAKGLKLVPMLKDMAIEKLEDGVEKFVKIALVVFNGFLALSDILPRLRKSAGAFLEKKGGVGGAIKSTAGSAMDKLSGGWDKVMTAVKGFKFSEAASAISAILSLVPAVLGGMFEDTNNEIPEIAETVKAVKDAQVSVDEQQKALKQAQVDFMKAMPVDQRRAVVMEQSTQLQPPQAGITTARLIKQAFKDQQNKQAFIDAFRTEFVKA